MARGKLQLTLFSYRITNANVHFTEMEIQWKQFILLVGGFVFFFLDACIVIQLKQTEEKQRTKTLESNIMAVSSTKRHDTLRNWSLVDQSLQQCLTCLPKCYKRVCPVVSVSDCEPCLNESCLRLWTLFEWKSYLWKSLTKAGCMRLQLYAWSKMRTIYMLVYFSHDTVVWEWNIGSCSK